MKLIQKFIVLGIVIFISLTKVKFVQAVDCRVQSFDEQTRTIMMCADHFTSEDEAQQTLVRLTCLQNSNMIGVSCGGGTGRIHVENMLTGGTIGTGADGNVWGCLGLSGLDRAIGKVQIDFINITTNQVVCTTTQVTKPDNWSFFENFRKKQSLPAISNFCTNTNNTATCLSCTQDGNHVWTAIGCVPVTITGFVQFFFPIAIALSGGIAFLLILFGGIQIMTSAGNPEKLNSGKDLVVSAITGLLLIIFSVFILRVIGYDILRIPGFSIS